MVRVLKHEKKTTMNRKKNQRKTKANAYVDFSFDFTCKRKKEESITMLMLHAIKHNTCIRHTHTHTEKRTIHEGTGWETYCSQHYNKLRCSVYD